MSNSVQRMAKAGENIRKLGFCMAAVFAGMLVAFAVTHNFFRKLTTA